MSLLGEIKWILFHSLLECLNKATVRLSFIYPRHHKGWNAGRLFLLQLEIYNIISFGRHFNLQIIPRHDKLHHVTCWWTHSMESWMLACNSKLTVNINNKIKKSSTSLWIDYRNSFQVNHQQITLEEWDEWCNRQSVVNWTPACIINVNWMDRQLTFWLYKFRWPLVVCGWPLRTKWLIRTVGLYIEYTYDGRSSIIILAFDIKN